jgi:ligand-binding sensor domain-containing protein
MIRRHLPQNLRVYSAVHNVAQIRALTTILPLPGERLLLGRKKRGVLLYDGKEIRELHETLSHTFVRTLSGMGTDPWIGTQDSGVLYRHAGVTDAFSER